VRKSILVLQSLLQRRLLHLAHHVLQLPFLLLEAGHLLFIST
jgi:hypothetical protein